MRNTFIALLLVNLVYLAWSHWIDEPQLPPVNETLSRLPRLKLLSELPAEQRPTLNTRTALSDNPACLSVGPFGDTAHAAKAAGILTSKGLAPEQRAEEEGASEGFWVFVDGLKNEVEADRARLRLEKGGIRDALVIPTGSEAGRRVSLGLFIDRPQAEQRVAAVKRMGLRAEITERKLPKIVYWIDLLPRPGMTTVPVADLFAEGVDSRIALQPCGPRLPPSSTAATQPVSTAPAGQPPAGTAPRLPPPAAPQPPTAGSPLSTQIAETPGPLAAGTAR